MLGAAMTPRRRPTDPPPAPAAAFATAPAGAAAATAPAHRWHALALLAAAQFFGMSLWFTASAVAPQLQALWELDAQQAGWLTTAVQLGFVAGTAVAAALNLADVVPARAYFTASALAGALANGLLVVAPGYEAALGLRFLTGFFLAGVYPPAMKMVATWFQAGRGLAIGTVVGALTLGKATPYLTRALEGADVLAVVLAASAGAVLAALLVGLGYREGPFPFGRRPFSWRTVATVIRHRPTRLAIGGYLGHMWELYAVWTWIPAFLAASAVAMETGSPGPVWLDIAAFGAIGTGALGCVLGGWWADRIGRARWVNLSMAASGVCCLVAGFFFGGAFWLLVLLAWVWGFFIVADSAQFSALVTEVAPGHAVGTALTLQTSLGFLLTMVTIQGVPLVVAQVGWQWAFPVLALGPAAGIMAIRRLQHLSRAASSSSAGNDMQGTG
jgi:MFS family permease